MGQSMPREGHKLLAFSVAGEQFGIDLATVREIRGSSGITGPAHSPNGNAGYIKLRGAIVPLVDLRARFTDGVAAYRTTTMVIVLSIEERLLGIVVDAVLDFLVLSASDIQAPPGERFVRDCSIVGLAHVGERTVAILDVEQLLAWELPSLTALVAALELASPLAHAA